MDQRNVIPPDRQIGKYCPRQPGQRHSTRTHSRRRVRERERKGAVLKRLCLSLVLCCAVGCGPEWGPVIEHAHPFGGAHRYIGEERTANRLAVIGGVGVAVAGVGLVRSLIEDAEHEGTPGLWGGAEPQWAAHAFAAGLGIVGLCALYDVIHAPMVARRKSKSARLMIAPDRLLLVCEF
jgi:hypothetical protein